MAEIRMQVRYRRMMKVSHPNHESNFLTDEKTISLPVEQTGFVLVDLWDCASVPEELKPGGTSFCERAGEITSTRIEPALEAARRIGLTVIHAPTSYVARKYPDFLQRSEVLVTDPAAPPAARQTWPPVEARQAWGREMEEARYGDYSPAEHRLREAGTTIPGEAFPAEGDWVIGSSQQMRAVCSHQRLLNLIYVGFATNMCLLYKPGALWEMSRLGYRCVVLRDCTTAVESGDTYDGLWMTRTFVDWFEMFALAYTARSDDFVSACDRATE